MEKKRGRESLLERLVRARGKLCPGYGELVRTSYLLRLPKNVTT